MAAVTDRQRIDVLERSMGNYHDCDLAWRDAKAEAIAAVLRWADGDPGGRHDWLTAMSRMRQARLEREAAKRALKIVVDACTASVETAPTEAI